MLSVIRTDTTNEDFKKLVSLLDAELKELDGEDHSFYAPMNKISLLKYAVVVYEGDETVGCGELKEYEPGTMEVGKRQPDAIALYTKNGYIGIPNFGPYAQDANSLCFEKKLQS